MGLRPNLPRLLSRDLSVIFSFSLGGPLSSRLAWGCLSRFFLVVRDGNGLFTCS